MIALWLVDTDSFGAIPRELLNLVDPSEEQQARLLKPADRRRFLISRIALRQGLSSVIGGDPSTWRFIIGETGKVSLVQVQGRPSVEFNLSHAGNAVAFAVSTEGSVGLDMEEADRAMASSGVKILPEEQFSEREKTHLESLNEKTRWNETLKLWTRKEAYSKLLGHGLNLDFSEIDVTDSNPDVAIETQEVSISEKPYFLSLALRRKAQEPMNIPSRGFLSYGSC
jgi:4'-phosphopantetheinyl transferase